MEPAEVPEPIPIIETSDDDINNNINTNGHSHSASGYTSGYINGRTNGTPSYIDSMAHLSAVHPASSRASRRPQMQLSNYEDEFATSVYSSRFAGMDLPRHHMPENEMPRDIAYRMIKDDLSLDNNPMLKYVFPLMLMMLMMIILTVQSLASFVTTYMVNCPYHLLP